MVIAVVALPVRFWVSCSFLGQVKFILCILMLPCLKMEYGMACGMKPQDNEFVVSYQKPMNVKLLANKCAISRPDIPVLVLFLDQQN